MAEFSAGIRFSLVADTRLLQGSVFLLNDRGMMMAILKMFRFLTAMLLIQNAARAPS